MKDGYVQIEGLEFANGEIEVEVAATIDPDLPPEFKMFARGFIGIAFRIQKDSGVTRISMFDRTTLEPMISYAGIIQPSTLPALITPGNVYGTNHQKYES